MVVTDVQDYIAAGQFRGGEQLIDAQQVTRPGTLLVFLEPLYKGGLEGVTPGSSCIANAYSSNHDVIASKIPAPCGALLLHAWMRLGLCTPYPAASGAGASLPDPCVQRSLVHVGCVRRLYRAWQFNRDFVHLVPFTHSSIIQRLRSKQEWLSILIFIKRI